MWFRRGQLGRETVKAPTFKLDQSTGAGHGVPASVKAGRFPRRGCHGRADIRGTVEGSLTVRELLAVRASARILSGSIFYGELEIEPGGMVIGTIRPLPEDAE